MQSTANVPEPDMLIKSKELKNGIRLVHLQHQSPVAHCGLIINAGSRDEENHPQGIAHFIEHMLFKGTRHRKTHHILSRIDEVGGELNAYTTKENTFIYASFLAGYFERALDIITDISFHSIFPLKEIEKERAVIIDEIHSYKDDPSEEINDEFDEVLFGRHPLGRNILGTVDSVSAIRQKDILAFQKDKYHTDQMVFCYIGPEKPERFFAKAEKYMEPIRTNIRKDKRKKFTGYKPRHITEIKNNNSCHGMIGNTAYGLKSKNRLPFFLLNNLLGGPGLNSRLNMNIREKYGYTYFIDASYTSFEETGEWAIYFATDKRNMEKTTALIYKELNKLTDQKLSAIQLEKAKTQLKGQLALANENMAGMLHALARSFLLFNKFETIGEIHEQIDKITAEKILELAGEVFDPKQLSSLQYIN